MTRKEIALDNLYESYIELGYDEQQTTSMCREMYYKNRTIKEINAITEANLKKIEKEKFESRKKTYFETPEGNKLKCQAETALEQIKSELETYKEIEISDANTYLLNLLPDVVPYQVGQINKNFITLYISNNINYTSRIEIWRDTDCFTSDSKITINVSAWGAIDINDTEHLGAIYYKTIGLLFANNEKVTKFFTDVTERYSKGIKEYQTRATKYQDFLNNPFENKID